MKYSLIFALLFAAITISSCGIFKKNNTIVNEPELTKHNPKVAKNVLATVDSLRFNYLKYNTLTMKFTADYTSNDKKQVFKGLMKIVKDTCVWISIRPGLGIELARFLLTPDSIKFVDRFHNEYFVGDYKFFEKKYKLKIDYNTVQAILTNEFFIYPPKTVNNSNLVGYTLNDSISSKSFLSTKFYLDTVLNHQNIYFNNKEYKIYKNTAANISNTSNITVEYDNFNTYSGKDFPVLIKAMFLNKDKKIIFNLEYEKLFIDKSVNPIFSIPDNYTLLKL